MPAPDRRFPFTFVDDLDAPELSAADRHHLERVRRLRPGDAVTVGDGAGRFRLARFGTDVTVDGPIQVGSSANPATTVAFALTKGDRPELVVQKLVEIGIDRIVPSVSERTVVRWDPAKALRNVERWRAIAREAAAQAHRPILATVEDVATFAEVAAAPEAALADPDGELLGRGTTTVLVGPEGGFTPAESAAVTRHVAIGEHVLRAETAAVAAGVLLKWVNSR